MSGVTTTKSASPPGLAKRAPLLTFTQIWRLGARLVYCLFMFLPCMLWTVAEYFTSAKKSLSGNVALVTGAGGALGRALCLQLAAAGCKIACADIVDDEAKETVRLVKEKHPGAAAFWYHCDVSSTPDIQKLRESILQELGPVELLVNNAGIVRGSLIRNVTDEKLNQIINVNLKSHFLMVREFWADLAKNGGHIVAIASMSSLYGLPRLSEYAATKHGVLGFMESLQHELRDIPGNKITTTCVCPYFIQTECVKKATKLSVPALPVSINARIIVDAIRKKQTVVSIPSFYYCAALILRMLPECYANVWRDTFYTKFAD